MLIGEGGYSKVWRPPRKDRVIEKKYVNNKYVQRLTNESLTDISKGQYVRTIFDKQNEKSSPLIAIYERPHRMYSEIRPFRDNNLKVILMDNMKSNNLKLFCLLLKNMNDIIKGLVIIHNRKWIHHDIKLQNILYNSKPFKLFLIDWATSVHFDGVYSDMYSPWFSADNMNHPPEYKSYAHYKYNYPFKKNDFATDYSNNTYILTLKKIEPNYIVLLNEANDFLQREFKKKNNKKFLIKIAPKVDVFAIGLVLARIYLLTAYATLYETSFHNKLIYLIKKMIHPNPCKRWSMKRSMNYLSHLVHQACGFVK